MALCMTRMWLPDGSRNPASMPYGCCVGSFEELDALAFQLLVGRLDVVGLEEEAAGGTLRHEVLRLGRRLGLDQGGPGIAIRTTAIPAGRPVQDREPAEVAISGTVTSSRSSIPSFSV